MTTRDRVATSSITYRTIGWTIKRYNRGIDEEGNQCAYIALVSLYYVQDPEDSNYRYTTFYCDKDTIYNAIGKASADWQETLYRKGGTVYLDAIMTVCYSGVPQGALTVPPAHTGRVYFTYEDIAGAEAWANPKSLLSHFNKSLTFPANLILLKESTYTVKHMERTTDNRTLPLSRYKKDTSGKLKDWTSHTFPYTDLSSHYYRFDHSKLQITYYDGHSENRTSSSASSVTVSNSTGQIARVTVTYYYRRVTQEEVIRQRYLLTANGKLNTRASASVTSSERNLGTNTENYDVTKGIPSGSYVNLSASVSPFAYEAVFRRYYGEFTCSVPARTTYRLVWSDSSGQHTETVTLNETYYVDRTFSFYCLSDYTIYTLQNVTFLQNALQDALQTIPEKNPVSCVIQKDADMAHHYTLPVTSTLTINGGTLTGNGSRPTPPSNAKQQEAAAAVGSIQVKNDRLKIGSSLLLDDTPKNKTAPAPTLPSENLLTSLKKQNCLIPETRQNSNLYTTTCTAHYKNISSKASLTKQFNSNTVVVHTPVVCDTQISDGKKWNQQETPDVSRASLILGRTFTLRTACTGFHSNLPGYGSRNYSEYVKEVRVRFPFPVYIGDTLLSENLWHKISFEDEFYLPTGAPEGFYTVDVCILAKNTPEIDSEQMFNSLCETEANTNRSHTIATRTLPVCVTGRLSDFSFFKDGSVYQVGTQDKDGKLNGNTLKTSFPVTNCSYYTELPFSLKTIGTPPLEGDYLKLVPSFYHVDENGQNRQSVDLYMLSNDNSLKKYSGILTLSNESATASGSVSRNVTNPDTAIKSVQTWTSSFPLPKPLIVVPSGTTLSDTLEETGSLSLKDSCFLQDGFLLINFSITYHRSSLPSLSYINRRNSERGYCNMWKTEGFSYSRTDAKQNVWQLKDGDTLLFSLKDGYRVYTTH